MFGTPCATACTPKFGHIRNALNIEEGFAMSKSTADAGGLKVKTWIFPIIGLLVLIAVGILTS